VKTLSDYLTDGLDIVSIGLNPSHNSVAAGFYFATPANRFWRALNESRLVPESLVPGEAAIAALFERHGIGFTDVVKRPSPGAAMLRAADYREWAPVLRDKLLRFRPRIAWFHGKLAYRNYLHYAEQRREVIEWGEQPQPLGTSVCFITPNPSPANAAFSLQVLIDWYSALAGLRDRLKA
jgi:TDG/mug DNA glycosylase family protein